MSEGVPAEEERLFGALVAGGESVPAVRDFLRDHSPDDRTLSILLRKPVPVAFLRYVGSTLPWSERPRVVAGVVLNPRTPRSLALRLVPALFWRDLADAAASPRLTLAVRLRAESELKDRLPDMRLGERITLARLATTSMLGALLADSDVKVVRAGLPNPRLREEDLLLALRRDTASRALIEEVAASPRWRESYAVRLALVRHTRTPLAVALAQLTSLRRADLLLIAEDPDRVPLLQMAARRVAEAARGEGLN